MTNARHASRHAHSSSRHFPTVTPTKSRSRSAEHVTSRRLEEDCESTMFARMVLKTGQQGGKDYEPRSDADNSNYEVDPPIINDVNVDLWNLYILVKNRGGFNKVSCDN